MPPFRPPPVPRSRPPRVRFATSTSASQATKPSKAARRLRQLGVVVGVGAVAWAVDELYYEQAIQRTLRVGFYGCAVC